MKKILLLLLALIAGNLLAHGQSYYGSTEENFADFWKSYCTNSEFQKSRIKFPLECVTYSSGFENDEIETDYINAKDWKFDKVYEYIYDLPQIKIEAKGDYYLVTRCGIESGFSVVYAFKLYNKKWYLMGIITYNY